MKRISFTGLDPGKRENYRKYKIFVLFPATRFDLKLPRKKIEGKYK